MKKLVLLFLAASLHAQTASVISLSKADTDKAANLYLQQKTIEMQIDALRNDILKRYVTDKLTVKDPLDIIEQKKALTARQFGFSFEFSDNFKFIVPSRIVMPSTGICSSPFINVNPTTVDVR